MIDLLRTVKQFFELDGWSFTESDTDSGLLLRFGGKNGQWRCYARVRREQGQFIFYSYAPLEVPEAKRTAIAEFVTRANFGLSIGNFELSFDSGTLQFRTGIDVQGHEECLSAGILKHLVYANVMAMDRYLPGIRSVVERDETPEQAIFLIEG